LDLTFLITSALTHFLVPAQKKKENTKKYKKQSIKKILIINQKNIAAKRECHSAQKMAKK